jgi:hypothetical protein
LDPNTLTQPDSVQKMAPKPDLETVSNRGRKPGHAAVSAPACNKNQTKKLRAALHTKRIVLIRLTFVNPPRLAGAKT